MQIGYEDRKQKFSMEHTYRYEGGEETMFEERKETPYDGKEMIGLHLPNSRQNFIKKCRAVYNKSQLDIRELDDEIGAILLKAEDAHFRVKRKARTRDCHRCKQRYSILKVSKA